MKEKFGIVESIETVHKNAEGKILSKQVINSSFFTKLLIRLGLKHNCITKYGMAEVAGLILVDVTGQTAFDYIAIGTGTNAATVDDSALYIEKSRLAAVGTRVTTTQDNDTSQLVVTFSQAADNALVGTDAICEIGVLNAATAGVLLLRQQYSPADNCNWDAGDTLQVTVKVQIKQGT